MSNLLENRIGSLEAVLEDLIDCYDTSGNPYTTGIVVDGEETEAEVPISTFHVLERAMNVLWNEADWYQDEEEE